MLHTPSIRAHVVSRQITAPIVVLAIAAMALTACSGDPKKAQLQDAVALMKRIVRSSVLRDAVRNADPQMRATTAAGTALSGGVTANFPHPPQDISIIRQGEDIRPWSVSLTGDDKKKEILIEGYGDDTRKPLIAEKIKFPPS